MGSDRALGSAGRPPVRLILFLTALALARFCQAAPDADEMLKRAVSLAASGRLDEAETVLVSGASAFRNDARFTVELAGLAWRRKEPRHAKRYLRQAIGLDPSNAYANEFLGSLYLLDGNIYAALKYWNRVRLPALSDVVFAPEPPLRPELRERLPAVSAGQQLTVERLAQTERNLGRLRIFTDPRYELTPSQGNEYALVARAPVVSQPLSGWAGRVLPLLRGLPYQQINLDWINIDQRAMTLTSLWRWDADKRRIAVKYHAPLRQSSYALWTDLRDEDWDLNWSRALPGSFGIRSAEIGGEVEFELAKGWRWTPGVRLSRHTFQNIEAQNWFDNSTVWEVRNRFDLPRWQYPERRIQADSSFTLRSGRIFSRESSRLFGTELDASVRWLPQQRDDVYAVRAGVRAAALSGRLPMGALYMTAMERDNDVWLRGHAGTQHGRKGNAPMGTLFVTMQTEAMRRLLQVPFLRLDAGPFLDVGNIGGEAALGSRGWLYDTGAQAVLTTHGGFRFSLIYGHDIRGGTNVLYTAVSR